MLYVVLNFILRVSPLVGSVEGRDGVSLMTWDPRLLQPRFCEP
jgi:hypothetical protein